jgi:hypothetical protein
MESNTEWKLDKNRTVINGEARLLSLLLFEGPLSLQIHNRLVITTCSEIMKGTSEGSEN